MAKIVFWETDIGTIQLDDGVVVNPIKCKLTDGREGYYLSPSTAMAIQSQFADIAVSVVEDTMLDHIGDI